MDQPQGTWTRLFVRSVRNGQNSTSANAALQLNNSMNSLTESIDGAVRIYFHVSVTDTSGFCLEDNRMNENTKITSQTLAGQITAHIEELAEATDAARMSAAMLSYLDTCSRFHRYSANNVWLILMSKPDATMVAGFNRWHSLNRYVKRGEHGIPILAPIVFKENPEDLNSRQVIRGFKVVYVFDISSTDGEPLPETPNWKSPEQNLILFSKLAEFAESKGISVIVKKLSGETQGVSKGGAIEIDPEAGVKTLVHEIAHEIMHRDANRPDDSTIRELEAESVAYVVGKHFGLEGLNSPNYIALHHAGKDLIMQHLDRISHTSATIIQAIEEREQQLD
ncbi:MAG: ArdC-like ssDNA-binding domain-containing protein [Chloroflexi bacterium]|nr:ArdC-like ssDNA-binding domain-containing protein [Chloroflexota bacterium]